jgi:hypothetical protein
MLIHNISEIIQTPNKNNNNVFNDGKNNIGNRKKIPIKKFNSNSNFKENNYNLKFFLQSSGSKKNVTIISDDEDFFNNNKSNN